MKTRPRRRKWLLAAAAAAVLLPLAVLVLLAPVLLDSQVVKTAIRQRIDAELGGRLSFERIEVFLFPHPGAVIHRPELLLPGRLSLSSEALSLRLRPAALLRGRIEPSTVRLQAPVLGVAMSALPPGAGALRSAQPRTLLEAAAAAARKLPETHLTVEGGRLSMTDAAGAGFEIKNLRGSVARRGGTLEAALACESDAWRGLTLEGELDLDTLDGSAQVGLVALRLAGLLARALPAAGLEILDGRPNLSLSAKFEADGRVSAGFRSEAATVTFRRGESAMEFGIGAVAGDLEWAGGRLTLTTQQIEFGAPKLTAALALTYDPAAHPRITAEISGTEVDADAVRGAALFLMPGSEAVRDIFNVVRGGAVPRIRVRLAGDRPAELTDDGNLSIQGRMEQGKIFIPGVALELEEVFGDAVIAGGVLEGTDLQARHHGTHGRDGWLRLGLSRAQTVFEHSIRLDADLAQLPIVLQRVVDHLGFHAELKRIQEFTGTARGTLRIEGTRQAPRVRVEAEDLRVVARYEPIGLPMSFRGGRVSYDASALEIADLDVGVGASKFSKVGGRLAFQEPFAFSARALAADLDAAETLGLARGIRPEVAALAKIRSLAGAVRLQALHLEGKARAGEAWKVTAAGEVRNLVLGSDDLPAPLTLPTGAFRWEGQELNARLPDARLGSSSLGGLSLRAGWGDAGRIEAHADSGRIVWDDLYPWLARRDPAARLSENVVEIRGTMALSGLSLEGPTREPGQWRYGGRSEISELLVKTTFMDAPLRVERGRVNVTEAQGAATQPLTIELDSIQVSSGANALSGGGKLTLSPADIELDLSVVAEQIDWNEIGRWSERLSERTRGPSRPVRGRLALRAERFVYDRFRFEPFYADARFGAEGMQLMLERASFCGIPVAGRLGFAGERIDAYLTPIVDGKELDGLVTCLTDQRSVATGRYNLEGSLQAKGEARDLLKSLTGELHFTAEKGRILRSSLLAKVLALVNLTEIYKGKLPDLSGEGVEYDRMRIAAEVQGGRLLISNWTIDGPSLWMGSRGEVDLAEGRLQLTVLVSPFKTIDRIINQIPGVRWILGGRLVAIPIRATGDVSDPQVTPLHPAAIGTGLLEMLERTLMLPATVIQPLIPGAEEQNAMDKSTIRKE